VNGGDPAVTLAVSGSNLTGDVPFSAALRLPDGAVHEARAPAGERGDLASLCRDLCAAHGVAPRDLAELRALEAALERMADGSYGPCAECGRDVGLERLKVEPAALRCIDCQRVHEKTFAQPERRTL